MFNKKLVILAIFFVSLLAVSAVSATDNVTGDIVSTKEINEDIVTEDNDNQDNMGDNGEDFDNFDDEYLINATYEKTWTDLADEIESTPDGGVLNLTANYRRVGGYHDKTIVIDKKITINGNNHIINGEDYRIFECYNGEVVLNNIIFYNAGGYGKGGAIYAECNLEINDCAFINNTADGNYGNGEGSAIYCQENVSLKNSIFRNHGYSWGIVNSKVLNIVNSSFYNNYCSVFASEELYVENSIFCDNKHGAIRSNGKSIIKNCNFTNNREFNDLGYYEGGAIIVSSSSTSKIENCSFTDNTASSGGAIMVYGLCEITGSKFVHNSGNWGGVIRVNSGSLNISSSVFIDNYADNGGVILFVGDNCIIQSSNFTGNRAFYDGGALECNGGYTLLENCNFLDNIGWENGNAIFSYGCISIAINCNFPDLLESEAGYNVTFIKCSFKKPDTNPSQNANTNTQTNTNRQTTTTNNVNTIKLTLKTVKVKKSAKKLVLQATLKQGNKALSGKKITFKFNGKKYTAKTNKKGVAKLTIKKNVLKKLKVGKKITYSATYGKVTKKVTVKVKK